MYFDGRSCHNRNVRRLVEEFSRYVKFSSVLSYMPHRLSSAGQAGSLWWNRYNSPATNWGKFGSG